MTKEYEIELSLIEKLKDLKYTWKPEIRDRFSLEILVDEYSKQEKGALALKSS